MANNVTDLGKVGITLKGEWNSSTSYERLDTVTYEGSLYIAVKDNVGSQPSESNTNWMLGAKHGEFTEQQLEDFKAEVVAESKEEMDDYTDDKKTELETYTGAKKAELDTYEGTKEAELNTYASGLKDDFDSNATSKTNAFNTNATSKTNDFDSNAVAKTTAFDTNASTKTSAFDDNATAKTTAFDENAEEKTGDFNDNVDTKTAEFDTHVEEKETEFDENVDNIQEQITDIQEFIDSELEQGITEKDTRADVSDSAKWYGELAPEGRTEQKQLSGKNLFNILDISRIYPGGSLESNVYDNILEMVATGTQGSQMTQYIVSNLDATKSYTISFKAKKVVLGQDGDHRLRANISGSNDGTNYTTIKNVDQPNPVVGTEYSLNWTITGYEYYRIYFYNNAASPVTIGEQTQYYDIQLEEGDTATDYEEFVGGQASPSPDYPQEIRNVEGRSCRNLFDKNSQNIVLGKYLNVDGTTANNANFSISDYMEVEANQQYAIQPYKGLSAAVCFYDSTKTFISGVTLNSVNPSLTTPNNCKYIRSSFVNTDADIFQINEGPVPLPYEPYFEGKRLEFNVCNKNLVKGLRVGYYMGSTGEYNANANYSCSKFPIYVKSGSAYKFSKDGIDIKGYAYPYDKDNNYLGRVYFEANSYYTPSQDTYYFNYAFGDSSISQIPLDSNVQIEQGTTATSFEEHKEQMIPFPLADGQKLMEGDYLADDGVHHVRTKMTLNGTETWNQYTSIDTDNYYGYRVDAPANMKLPPNSTTLTNYVCDKFTEISWNGMLHIENRPAFAIRFDNARIYIHAPFATIAELTEWLSNNNMTIEYDLTQEVIDTYTEEQAEAYNKLKKLMLNQGVNHIWTETDGVEPNLQLTYYKSNKERLNNIEARLELLEE